MNTLRYEEISFKTVLQFFVLGLFVAWQIAFYYGVPMDWIKPASGMAALLLAGLAAFVEDSHFLRILCFLGAGCLIALANVGILS